MAYWCDGSGRLQLELTLEEASSGSHSGDCEEDVRALMQLPHVASQVEAWPIDLIREHLEGFGAWDAEELADEDMCRARTLWLACGDIVESPEEDEE